MSTINAFTRTAAPSIKNNLIDAHRLLRPAHTDRLYSADPVATELILAARVWLVDALECRGNERKASCRLAVKCLRKAAQSDSPVLVNWAEYTINELAGFNR